MTACLLLLAGRRGHAQTLDQTALRTYDTQIKQKSSQLDSVRTALEQGRSRLGQLKEKEGSHLRQLSLVEENLSLTRRYLVMLGDTIARLDTALALLEDSLDWYAERLVLRERQMAQRLRAMYMTSSTLPPQIEMVLKARNMTDLLRRVRYFQRLREYDHMMLVTIDSLRQGVGERRSVVAHTREQVAAMRNEKVSQEETYRQEQEERTAVLAEVREKKKVYLEMVESLEAAQAQLNVIIEQLTSRRRKAKEELARSRRIAFEKRKGGLLWPVSGSVVKPFGKIVHPVYKTVTVNNGIDISAQKGEQVQCVAPGTVVYTGFMRGLGKFVVVDHAGGYLTIYARLGAVHVARDQEVAFGAIVGSVAAGSQVEEATLHFEVRNMQNALDPLVWLESRTLTQE